MVFRRVEAERRSRSDWQEPQPSEEEEVVTGGGEPAPGEVIATHAVLGGGR